MNLAIKSFFYTIKKIKKNPFKLSLLVLVQFILAVALISSIFFFGIKTMNGAQEIILTFEGANYNPEQIKEGVPFLANGPNISSLYDSMIKNFFWMILSSLIIFILINGLAWMVTYSFDKHNLFRIWKRFTLICSITLFAFFSLAYLLVKLIVYLQLSTSFYTNALYVGGIILILLSYLLCVSFGLLKLPLKIMRKKLFKQAFKSDTIILAFGQLVILLGLGYLLFIVSEKEIFLPSLILVVLFFVCSAFFKIWWVTYHEKSYN